MPLLDNPVCELSELLVWNDQHRRDQLCGAATTLHVYFTVVHIETHSVSYIVNVLLSTFTMYDSVLSDLSQML